MGTESSAGTQRRFLIAGAVLLLLVLLFILRQPIAHLFHDGPPVKQGPNAASPEAVADHLSVPWGLAVLPDGDLLVTERPGTLKRIGQNRQTHPIAGVEHTSEGGLLGLALDPDFVSNRWIYLYLTTEHDGALENQVQRYTYGQDQLRDKKVLFGGIPASQNHDGGRLAFGPDGKLYITTGDAGTASLAQDTHSLAGKILRLNADGSVPAGNPFGNAVYSYGHRNPQGLAWDDKEQLWETEHGPSGTGSGFDELNRITKGANYGWPLVTGDENRAGLEPPIVHSGASDTWAPAGLAYAKGSLYFGGLRGQTLYRAVLKADGGAELQPYYQTVYGRLRTTLLGAGGLLYFTTSNTDGRGSPRADDDKIFRLRL